MKLWITALVASAALVGVAAAAAETPEEVAAARAEGDRLIAASGAPQDFVNRTHTAVPYIVHRPSGVPCMIWEKTGGVVEMLPPTAEHAGGFRCAWSNGYPGEQVVVRPLKARSIVRFRDARLSEYRALHPDLTIDHEIPGDPNGRITGAPMLTIMFTYGGTPPTRYGCASVSLLNGWEVTRLLDDSVARPGFKKDSAEFECTLYGMGVTRSTERPVK